MAALEYTIEFELINTRVRSGRGPAAVLCRHVLFRVVSIGQLADPGIPFELMNRSCHTQPLNAELRVEVPDCMRLAQSKLRDDGAGGL